jgi:Fic family protein
MTGNGEKRESRALDPTIIADPQLKAETEAANGLRQYDLGIQIIQEALDRRAFKLRPSRLLDLNRAALDGLNAYAGNWRPGPVTITHSKHIPPDAHLVPGLIEEMCDYVNDSWAEATAIHLASYVMWRLNWIHPFADGNGRTSRISSYVILSIRSGFVVPGSPTIPAQIANDKNPYIDALEDADTKWSEGKLDVKKMEELQESLLARQLANFYESAGGKLPPTKAAD